MGKRFLFVMTSQAALGETGNRTGSWLEELAAPWLRLSAAGYEPMIATPLGNEAPIDPASKDDAFISDAGRHFLADPATAAALAATSTPDKIDPDGLSGMLLVGGAGSVWDLPLAPAVARIAESLAARGAVVAALSHGVTGLTFAVDPSSEPLIKNRRITCISEIEDGASGLDKVLPLLPEKMVRKMRGLYSAGAPGTEHVVVDPPFFTGQNFASADALARRIVSYLAAARPNDEAASIAD